MSTTTNHVRRLESDPQAVADMANGLIAAVREGRVSGDPKLVSESMYRLASQIEGWGPHLAGDLEDYAARVAAM